MQEDETRRPTGGCTMGPHAGKVRPMDVERAIRLRRSIRHFAARDVSPSVVKRLLDLARRAPSSMNGQPWHFVVVRDPATKRAIADIKNRHCPPEKRAFPADFVARAPVVVVICVDVERSHDRELENGVLAAGHLLLAARALGVGSVYLSAHTAERPALRADIKELLDIPTAVEPISIVPLGYPARRPDAKELRDLGAMIHDERF